MTDQVPDSPAVTEGEARQSAFYVLTRHPDCIRDDVSLNELIEGIAKQIVAAAQVRARRESNKR